MVGRFARRMAAFLCCTSISLAQSEQPAIIPQQPALIAQPLHPIAATPLRAIPNAVQQTIRGTSPDRIRGEDLDRDEKENKRFRDREDREESRYRDKKPAASFGRFEAAGEPIRGVSLRDAEEAYNRGQPTSRSRDRERDFDRQDNERRSNFDDRRPSSSSRDSRVKPTQYNRDREGFLDRESRWDPVDDELDEYPRKRTPSRRRPSWDSEEYDRDYPAESMSFFGLFRRREHEPDPLGTDSSFESDRDCEHFVSPVSNPFYAEDPRKISELKPIIIYQSIPKKQWVYQGGNALFFGLQGRLGITERWSIVMNKLGLVLLNPGSGSILDNETGLSEIWIGPKWTFLKNTESGLIMATGATFQLPIGGSGVYQNTGNFGLAPYLSAAKKFGRGSFGEFTYQQTIGYNFGFSSERSDLFYTQFHIDYDVGSMGRFFPMIELNWFAYTQDGDKRPFYDFEFGDMGNIGSRIGSRNYLNLALGGRIRFSESFQFGLATEFPLLGTRDLNNFRLTTDFIWRY